MIAVLQRVNSATVIADGEPAGKIGKGLYILLGVMQGDGETEAGLLAEKICKLRIFCDDEDKMNLSVRDVGGEILVVSNFTLGANYSHGNRPDYFGAASPDIAERLYLYFLELIREKMGKVEAGVFGADMQSELSTDGPVTIVMNSDLLKKGRG